MKYIEPFPYVSPMDWASAHDACEGVNMSLPAVYNQQQQEELLQL